METLAVFTAAATIIALVAGRADTVMAFAVPLGVFCFFFWLVKR